MPVSKKSVVPERKAFAKYLETGMATLGSVLEKYPRNSFNSGMLRVARLIRQECLRVPSVIFGLANGDKVTGGQGSGKLRDELLELAEKSPDLKIIWVKAPNHRD
jgi:hypothetical protein